MNTTKTRNISRFLFAAATAGTIALGAAGSVSATTEPPADSSAATDAAATSDVPAPTAGEPASPEAAAFCEAEMGVEAASSSEDPAAIEPAIAAAMEAAPPDAAPLLEAVVTQFEATGGEGPEFDAAYGELVAWMQENCGYAQLNLTASEYAFGGLPTELSAGPHIVSLANIGEEVHEIAIFRINDDVTMTLEELLALPEDEAFENVTPAGFAFAFPDAVGHTVANLTAGNYVALCFLPEHADPEMLAQMSGPDSSAPPGADFGPPHFTLGMVQGFTVS